VGEAPTHEWRGGAACSSPFLVGADPMPV
jgi:hypothetical protein